MNTHKNAPLTPAGRERMVRAVVDDGKSKAAVARAFRTTAKTVGKWVGRFGEHGVHDFAFLMRLVRCLISVRTC